MGSWIFILAKFSPEALLFEATLILFLGAGYAAFYIIRKRRLGAVQDVVPASLVKSYLNDLLFDAEQMRAQLFGLLESTDAHGNSRMHAFGSSLDGTQQNHPPDEALLKKIADLETQLAQKIAEKDQAIQAAMSDKEKVVKELELLKGQPGAGASGGAGDSGLQEKIKALEARLAEYSVIEDDLANLKRLQQENAQLKAALAEKGISLGNLPPIPAAEAVPAPDAASAPQAAAQAAPPPPAAETAPIAAAEKELSPAASEPEPAFDQLVDQVEKSLQGDAVPVATAAPATPATEAAPPPAAAQATAAPASATASAATPVAESPAPSGASVAQATAAPPTPAAAADAVPPPAAEKSDADLVAEFEKMLGS